MQRARAQITYPASGGPGLITLYTRSTGSENGTTAQLTTDRLKNALTAGRAMFDAGTTFSSFGTVDDIDAATGNLTGFHDVTPWTVTGSAAGGSYAPLAVAVCATWKTLGIVRGRRVQGRTFLSPLAYAMMQADGTPTAACLTAAQALAVAWLDNGLTDTFATVWARPRPGQTGSAEDITAYFIKDKFAVLRSRRD